MMLSRALNRAWQRESVLSLEPFGRDEMIQSESKVIQLLFLATVRRAIDAWLVSECPRLRGYQFCRDCGFPGIPVERRQSPREAVHANTVELTVCCS